MRRLTRFLTVGSALVLAGHAFAAPPVDQKAVDALNAMKGLNVIALQSWNITGNGDVEGKAWVGGNVTGNKAQVGFGNAGQSSGRSTYDTLTVIGSMTNGGVDLYNGAAKNGKVGAYSGNDTASYAATVGGNVTNTSNGIGTKAENARIAVGGNVGKLSLDFAGARVAVGGTLSDANFNGSGLIVQAKAWGGQNLNSLNGGSTVSISGPNPTSNANPPSGWIFNVNQTIDAKTTADMQAAKTTMVSNMQDLTTQLVSLGGTSATKVRAGGSSTQYDLLFNVTAGASGYSSFAISAADLFGARNLGFALNGSGAPIIVNVTGIGDGTFNWNLNAGVNGYANAVYNSSLSSQIIWNFADAGANSVLNFLTQVEGSVLSPNGTINTSNNIEGTVVAGIFNQGGEVHLGTFLGGDTTPDGGTPSIITTLSAAVPEPASWMMMVIGFGVIGSAIRRTRTGEKQADTIV